MIVIQQNKIICYANELFPNSYIYIVSIRKSVAPTAMFSQNLNILSNKPTAAIKEWIRLFGPLIKHSKKLNKKQKHVTSVHILRGTVTNHRIQYNFSLLDCFKFYCLYIKHNLRTLFSLRKQSRILVIQVAGA